VNQADTPALWRVRTQGVHFENSHSVFPTFTTANASSIATGHQIGDTGDFSNTIWTGYATFDTGNFGLAPGTAVPFIENDRVLADLTDHFGGNYLDETTLLAAARAAGYNHRGCGQTRSSRRPGRHRDRTRQQTVSRGAGDDLCGRCDGVSGGRACAGADPRRDGIRDPAVPAADAVEWIRRHVHVQQRLCRRSQSPRHAHGEHRPAALVRGRDDQAPVAMDGAVEQAVRAAVLVARPRRHATQSGRQLECLRPGINGDASAMAVQNADADLAQILAWLDANPAVKANTNLFVTSGSRLCDGRSAGDRSVSHAQRGGIGEA
jgi:hypothetical protein